MPEMTSPALPVDVRLAAIAKRNQLKDHEEQEAKAERQPLPVQPCDEHVNKNSEGSRQADPDY
jgi:hypothetical protein